LIAYSWRAVSFTPTKSGRFWRPLASGRWFVAKRYARLTASPSTAWARWKSSLPTLTLNELVRCSLRRRQVDFAFPTMRTFAIRPQAVEVRPVIDQTILDVTRYRQNPFPFRLCRDRGKPKRRSKRKEHA